MTAKTSRGGAAATNFQLCSRGARWRGSDVLAMAGIVRIGRRRPAPGVRMFDRNRGSGQERAAAQRDPLGDAGQGTQARPERCVLAAEVAEHLAVPPALELVVAGAGGGRVLVVGHAPHVVEAAAV